MMMEKTRDTRTIGVAIIRLNGITIKSQCRSKFDNLGGAQLKSIVNGLCIRIYEYEPLIFIYSYTQTIKTIDFKRN